jgi:hypothetical protein
MSDTVLTTRLRTLEARVARVEDELSVRRRPRLRLLTDDQVEAINVSLALGLLVWYWITNDNEVTR